MQLFKSKKFWMAVTGVIVVLVNEFVPGVDEKALSDIVYLIIAAIVGQGLADFGKEAKKD
jgi:hypothetical protein